MDTIIIDVRLVSRRRSGRQMPSSCSMPITAVRTTATTAAGSRCHPISRLNR